MVAVTRKGEYQGNWGLGAGLSSVALQGLQVPFKFPRCSLGFDWKNVEVKSGQQVDNTILRELILEGSWDLITTHKWASNSTYNWGPT